MAHVNVEAPALTLDEPMLLDGLPGTGFIGKLIADHAVSEFGMEYYAGVYCEGVPTVGAYRPDDTTVRPPAQLYADEDRDLLALVSDVPVSPSNSPEFAQCLANWFAEHSVTPIFVCGLTEGFDPDGPGRQLYGLSTGDGDQLVEATGLSTPPYAGIVTGPSGALLNKASEVGLDSTGVLVESNGQIPDYDGASAAVERGVEPIAGVDLDTDAFDDRTMEMSHVAESAINRMSGSDDGTTGTQPTPTFY